MELALQREKEILERKLLFVPHDLDFWRLSPTVCVSFRFFTLFKITDVPKIFEHREKINSHIGFVVDIAK